jgi:hypothetical protein
MPEDGRQCEQDSSLRAMLESESVSIDVAKPGGLRNRTLTLNFEARGEAKLNITFIVRITRLEASSGAVSVANGSVHIDQPSISAFGQHIQWVQRPPAATWLADLDGRRLNVVATSQHEFNIRLECGRAEQSCAADGDIITTVFELQSAQTPQNSRLELEVTVHTKVKALASCENSKTWLVSDSDSLSTSTAFRVYLKAFDIDMLPISYSRAPVEFRLDSLRLPQQWNLGSNEYAAEVFAAGNFGAHVLRAVLLQGWDNTTRMQRDCILLEQQVVLKEPVEGNRFQFAVVIGVVAGVVAIVLACCCFCLKKQSSAKCLTAVVPGIALQPRTWLWRK